MNHQERGSTWNTVFVVSLIIIFAVVLWGWMSPEGFEAASMGLFNFLIEDFGWLYMLSMAFFVVFPIGLAMSRFGKVRLGPADSRPDYSTLSWFAMLFSAGMSPSATTCTLLWVPPSPSKQHDRPCASPFSTGDFTPGRPMPFWRWPWPISNSERTLPAW
jgi:hypothetical protein